MEQNDVDDLLRKHLQEDAADELQTKMETGFEAFAQTLPAEVSDRRNSTRRIWWPAIKEREFGYENRRLPWRWLAWMRVRYAPPATVMAVIVIGIFINLSEISKPSTLAFAQVQEQIRVFRPYSYTQTVRATGEQDHSRRVMYWSLTQRRQENPGGSIDVFDLGANPVRVLTLVPDSRLALEKTYTGVGPTLDFDLLATLASLQTGDVELLGSKKMDGREIIGFQVPDPKNDWTVWADVQTGLPVYIELAQPRLGRMLVMSDFNFDESFDQSLFSTEAPPGYTVQKIREDGRNPTEQDLLNGLRALAELMDDEFPANFDARSLRALWRAQASDEYTKALAERAQMALRYIVLLQDFYRVMDFTYQCGGVKLGDGQTPVAWWLPQGTAFYRVVYGDLTVRDVEPDQMPDGSLSSSIENADKEFRPYSCIQTVVMDDGSSSSSHQMILDPMRRRELLPDGSIMIVDSSAVDVRYLRLSPDQDKAELTIMPGKGPTVSNPDLLVMIARIQDGSEQDLGTKMIQGRRAEGFRVSQTANEFEVWLDQDTGMPLVFEITHIGHGRRIIHTDFNFDEAFDDSLFSTTPPAGFSLEQSP
jgi:outer membrane lipoprotein-sorting protein